MLAAQKQEASPENPSAAAPTPAAGFGRVLTSIQGLQRRLSDFSAEDVSLAEANARTLIQQLSLLELKLKDISALKQCAVTVNRLISEIPEENFDHVDTDGLDHHPKLRAIIQAGKFIQSHRHLLATNSSSESVSFDGAGGALMPSAAVESSTAEVMAPSPDETRAARDVEEAVVAGSLDQTKNSSDDQWVFTIDTAPGTTEDILRQEFPAQEFVDPPIAAAREQQNQTALQKSAATRRTDQVTAPISAQTSYDERLLNELIQAYGEFAASSGSDAQAGAPVAAESTFSDSPVTQPKKRADEQRRVEQATLAEPPSTAPIKRDEPVTTAAVVRKLPAAPADTVPVLAETARAIPMAEKPEPVHSNDSEMSTLPALIVDEADRPREAKKLPSARKHGEIDRQLKSIIKDYGEYDLYPRQNSMNLKIAAIAAFAVLGLVLGGFYFFKAPAPVASTPVNGVAQPDTTKALGAGQPSSAKPGESDPKR